jgi:transcriptional regulator with PAS, ATPase and Fis domain
MPAKWVPEFPAEITVCDAAGIILEMNEKAAAAFAQQGGRALIGSNLLNCHAEASRTKLQGLLKDGKTNVYTIEKNGVRKLIFQAPWFERGKYGGLVELSLTLPDQLPHFVREV